MARKRSTQPKNVIEQAVNHFDETVKRYLESIPKQIQDAEINPPHGSEKQHLRPFNQTNPFGGI
tara:strand:+ start:53 stop:244 length:192 start_codon:yes stop_codon:yes gene_type:complete